MADLNRNDELRAAIELLYFGYRRFTEGPDRLLAKRGLNRVHHRILYFVGRNPGIPVNELLQLLAVSKQALNQPMRQLIEMGLVKNERSAVDGRVRLLSLSEKGTKLEDRLSQSQIELLASIFESAGAKAERGWFTVMTALTNKAL